MRCFDINQTLFFMKIFTKMLFFPSILICRNNCFILVNYLNYGPFSSHAPLYDSSFSNVSKDESDLLLSTYGDESGAQYAQRLVSWSLRVTGLGSGGRRFNSRVRRILALVVSYW